MSSRTATSSTSASTSDPQGVAVGGAFLATPRLRLRPPGRADRLALRCLFATPEQSLYLPGGPVPPADRAMRCAGLVDGLIEHWRELGYGPWTLAPAKGGPPIGLCGLRQAKPGIAARDTLAGTTGELIYALDRLCWGRGLTTEAAHAALADGFSRLGLVRVIALTHPDNHASCRVLAKLGLRPVGRGPKAPPDILIHAVERADFRLPPPADAMPQDPIGDCGADRPTA